MDGKASLIPGRIAGTQEMDEGPRSSWALSLLGLAGMDNYYAAELEKEYFFLCLKAKVGSDI